MRSARVRVAALLLTLVVAASCSADADAGGGARTSAASTEPSTALAAPPASAPPVEFTACVGPGPEVTYGTEDLSRVALPEGEMTINRSRGWTWQSEVSDVSEPRLVGTWYNSFDSDEYTDPGGGPGPAIFAVTHRIENDAGAWHGSLVSIHFPDGEESHPSIVLIGEGDYEGLTAVGTMDFGAACPNMRGYIIDGSVPAPPVPNKGR